MAVFASVLITAPMLSGEVFADPSDKLLKQMEKVAKLKQKLDSMNGTEKNYDKIQEKFDAALAVINAQDVYLEEQDPITSNLDEESEGISTSACCTHDMKVRAGYKDPYTLFGIIFYSYYYGPWSNDISSGSTSQGMTPTWSGLEQGIITFCETGSSHRPTTASYDQSMLATDANDTVLINTGTTDESSYFVWYDQTDRFEYAVQNNLVSGPTFLCTIKNVSTS